jgi:hypothetical protein
MKTWEAIHEDGEYCAAIRDESGRIVHAHPIPFETAIEADRAVARLNAKEAGIAGVPVPVQPEAEARAARLARIAELRAKRQSA